MRIYLVLLALSSLVSSQKKSLGCDTRIMFSDTVKSAKFFFGIASYYSDSFNGKRTANGEIFNQQGMTAAHNQLPLGTVIRVTNLRNNKSVVVRINDRLHRRNKRLVDLSKAAAKKLGFVQSGITRVKIEILGGDMKSN